MTALPDITARIRLDTSDLDRSLARAGGSMRKFGGLATAALAGIGVAETVKAVAGIGIAYQDSLNTFKAVSGANAEQLKEVGKEAKRLGSDLELPNTSAAGAAEALTELAKAGLSVKDSLKAGKGTLQLATAAMIGEGEAATITANALNAFKLEGKDATRVANVLANAANVSSGEVTDFANGLAQGGLAAKNAGLSIEETAGALALFANNGLKGSDAGTSLKTMLMRLQAPTGDVQKKMRQLGIDVRDANGEMLPLSDIAQVLQDKLKGLTSAQRDQALAAIFGSDAIRAGTLLYDAGRVGVDKYTTSVSRAGGAADVAAAKSKGLGGALKGLKSTAETISLEVFEKVAPALERGVRAFTVALPKLFSGVGKAIGAALSAPLVLGIVGPITGAIAKAKKLIADFLAGPELDFSGFNAVPVPNIALEPPLTAPKKTPKIALEPPLTETKIPDIPLEPAFILPAPVTLSEKISTAIERAISKIDAATVGKKLAVILVAAMDAAAAASKELTVAFGRLIARIDFGSLGLTLGKAAVPLIAGLVTGLLGNLTALLPFIRDHFGEVLIAAVSVIPVGRIAGSLGKAVAEIPVLRAFAPMLGRIGALGGLVERAFGALGRFASRFVTGALDALEASGAPLISGVVGLFRSVGVVASTEIRVGIGKVVTFLHGVPGQARGALSSLPGTLGKVAGDAIAAFTRVLSASGPIGQAIARLMAAVSRPFANIGSLLYNAGRRLISGFIDGISSMFGSVKSKLGELTGKLTSWKGPPATDARLLVDNGKLVMGGFITGLESRFGEVRGTLRRMTTDLADVGGLRAGGPSFVQQRLGVDAHTSGGLTIGVVNVHGGTAPSEERLTTSLRNLAWTMGV